MWLKIAAWVLLSLPLTWLAFAIVADLQSPGAMLGADPGEAVLLYLGQWGIRILLLALSVSSIRRRLGYAPVLKVRRLIGLFAFAYLALHFLFYLWFFTEFDGALIVEELAQRPYISVGFAALLILCALAATSTKGWQRRLRRGWKRLHRLVHVAAALGLLHLWWLTKDGYGEVVLYGVWLAALYADRRLASRKARRST